MAATLSIYTFVEFTYFGVIGCELNWTFVRCIDALPAGVCVPSDTCRAFQL